MEERVNRRMLAAGSRRVTVARAAFGTDAPLIGSACCVFQELFSGRLFR